MQCKTLGMAMMVQPTVSSMMAESSSVIPTLRRMNFISRTTVATLLDVLTDRGCFSFHRPQSQMELYSITSSAPLTSEGENSSPRILRLSG
jgi:predicted transcriptional regulator